jgi:WD40 repeat protein
MRKEKAKGSPRSRYGLWLFFGLLIGVGGAFLAILGLFEPRRDMVFAESAEINIGENIFYAGYSPDEQFIYTQSSDGHFRIWDSEDVAQLHDYTTNYMALQWNPEKSHFLGIDYLIAGVLFDSSGQRVTAFEHEAIHNILWNPTGTRVITISDRESKLWTVDGYLLQEFPQPRALFDTALWSPDGTRFVVWNDVTASMYDADGNELKSFETSGYPSYYGWNSGSTAYAVSQYSGEAETYETRLLLYSRDGEKLWEKEGGEDVPQILWNANGSRIAALSYSPEAQATLYSIEGEELTTFPTSDIFLWHPDGESLVTGTNDLQELNLLDSDGELIQALPHDVITAYSYPQWSPNGEFLATWGGSADGSSYTLYLWDKAGNLLQEMSESSPIYFVVWSPDSSKILSVGSYIARIWSIDGGEINSLNHAQPISMAQWSNDGSRILTMGAYTSYIHYENAIWTSEGEHIATLFTGDPSWTYVSEWNDDFSEVLVLTSTGLSVRRLQAGSIYFDFRFDKP